MAEYSGIYKHFEGTDAQCDAIQENRETAWSTDSGMFRYQDNTGTVHYIDEGKNVWGISSDLGGSIYPVGTAGERIVLDGMVIYNQGSPSPIHFSGQGLGTYFSEDEYGISIEANDGIYLTTTNDSLIRTRTPRSGILQLVTDNTGASSSDGYIFGINGTSEMYLEGLEQDPKLNLISTNGDMVAQTNLDTGAIWASGDMYHTPYTLYLGTSTINGWTGTPTGYINIKRTGKTVYVWYRLGGTGSGTVANVVNFTVPWDNRAAYENNFPCHTVDGGSGYIGYAALSTGNTVTIYQQGDSTAVWTSGVNRYVNGYLCYETNDN